MVVARAGDRVTDQGAMAMVNLGDSLRGERAYASGDNERLGAEAGHSHGMGAFTASIPASGEIRSEINVTRE